MNPPSGLRISLPGPGQEWEDHAAQEIAAAAVQAVSQRGVCHFALTGGRSALRLYSNWRANGGLPWRNMRFYFGDERCVPPEDDASNYGMAMNILGGIGDLCVFRMEGEAADLNLAARRYEACLPTRFDIVLLGVGDDGHIASIFPDQPQLMSETRLVVPTFSRNAEFHRLTITPQAIIASREVFLLAPGTSKGRVLSMALEAPQRVTEFPIRLVLARHWLLDRAAARVLYSGS